MLMMMMAAKNRVIVDVDVGTDDYLALLMLVKAEQCGDIKIEAIICTMGNTSVDNVCRNVVRLLEILNRTDIPVYKGATKQLIPPKATLEPFEYGTDGFGDLQYDKEPDLSVIKTEPAAVALRDLIINNPNEISLICLAPLTNLALTIRLDDDICSIIKDLWIMGGNSTGNANNLGSPNMKINIKIGICWEFQSVVLLLILAVGNITSSAEYNFYVDPEAVYIVLDSIKKPIYILTWETSLLTNISFDWRYNVFGIKNNPAIELLNRVEKLLYKDNEKWIPCDAYVIAAYLHPDVILQQNSHNASIELHGSQTRGQVVLDHTKKSTPANVTIIEKINCEKFQQLLMDL